MDSSIFGSVVSVSASRLRGAQLGTVMQPPLTLTLRLWMCFRVLAMSALRRGMSELRRVH